MRISGLGSLGSSSWPTEVPQGDGCPPNPCTWWDNTRSVAGYASQECIDYMVCSAPTDPTTIALTKGLVSGVTTAVGEDVGNVASDAVEGFTGGLGKPFGLPGWLVLSGAVVIGLMLLKKSY